MKNAILIPALMLAMITTVMAQKDKAKDVKTKYLSLPSYDLSKTDPATIIVEFAIDEGKFGTAKLKDVEATCIPKGGSIKDVIKITTYYYELPFTKPESYLVAKNASGNIVYASRVSEAGRGTVKFGYEKCEYWRSDKLKKDWASKSSSFKVKEKKKHKAEMRKYAMAEAKAKIYLSYIKQEFKVYSAKGKNFDYADLESAFEKAQKAYKNIGSAGPNQTDFNLLKECIGIWEKELATLDSENKKARINKNIAKGLHENSARAYMYMYDFDKAIEHGRAFQKLFGNMHTNRTNAFDALVIKMEMQKIAAKENSSLLSDISALNAKANSSSGKSININNQASSDFARLKGEYISFRGSQASDVRTSRKEEEEEAIASGKLNPYQKYVSQGLAGPVIMMTMAPSVLSGFPELTEFPKEMCELENLIQILIMNNKIASVPAGIGNLKKLNKLDLTGNNLKTLPAEIGQLTELKTLRLGKNPIESMPKEIANCANLKTLVLKGCKLSVDDKEELARLLPNCKIKY